MNLSAVAANASFDAEREQSRTRQLAFQALAFVASFALLVSRRPDVIFNAQFYAEDGARWYADAYHLGWRCLLLPETGYLQTVSRLIALISLLFPFTVVPLFMNFCALIVQILPVNLFLSDRFGSIPFHIRLIAVVLYLGLPNSVETHANTTNIPWHLALLACLVLFAAAPTSRNWKLFDFSVLVCISLDSPLGFVLVPLAAALMWKRRDNYSKWPLAILIPGTFLQLLVLVYSHSRMPVENGATLARLAGILGGQVFLSAVFGVHSLAQLYLFYSRQLLLNAELACLILGFTLMLCSFRYARFELRLFLLFSAAVLAMALLKPISGPDRSFPQWEYLQIPGRSSRYYFFPILAFYAALLSLAGARVSHPVKFVRYVAIAVLIVVPVGIYRDWRHPRFVDLHFASFAADFERAAPGTRITIPINPVGWEMQLVKH
jgi:hypothetical protein